MTARANALDDFLAQIAAFGEAHRVIDANLQQQIILVKVDGRNEGYRLRSGEFLRLLADPCSGVLFVRRGQFFRECRKSLGAAQLNQIPGW